MTTNGLPFPAPYLPRAKIIPEGPLKLETRTQVDFPPLPPPVSRRVFNAPIRALQVTPGDILDWPRANPLAIIAQNNHDAACRVSVHGGVSPDTGRLLTKPLKEFDVGPNERIPATLNPGGDDEWQPYVWPVVLPLSLPTIGDMQIDFTRLGI